MVRMRAGLVATCVSSHLRRRDSADFSDHESDRVTKFFHHVLVARQSMPFSMVKNKSCIGIADVVERDVAV
jgi:hypothetical protein